MQDAQHFQAQNGSSTNVSTIQKSYITYSLERSMNVKTHLSELWNAVYMACTAWREHSDLYRLCAWTIFGLKWAEWTQCNFQGSTHSTNGIFGHVTQRALHKKWSNIPKHLMSSHTFNTMQHSGSTRTSRKKFSKDIEPSATSCESCLGSSIIYNHTRTS